MKTYHELFIEVLLSLFEILNAARKCSAEGPIRHAFFLNLHVALQLSSQLDRFDSLVSRISPNGGLFVLASAELIKSVRYCLLLEVVDSVPNVRLCSDCIKPECIVPG